ncbi:MAG: VanZ family protein [Kangiellaceae bacterium]|nr:VanZ family protein [Kangiellaceae bacterium]
MRLIWYIVIFFIAYGSLYPFNFDLSRQIPDDLMAWLLNWEQRTIRSDVIANVLLFIPFGFFGALTIQQETRRYPLLSIVLMLLGGVVFASLLQLLQFYLPSRVPHAADATINSIGILIGIALAAYTNSQRINRLIPERLRFRLTPALVVLVLWLGWQFFPYIPVFEGKQFGKGLSGIVNSQWSLHTWLLNLLFWLVFFYVLQRVVQKSYRLGLLIALSVFILIIKLSMFRSQLGWSELSSVPLALLIHQLTSERLRSILIALGALMALLWQNLYPWQWQQELNGFQWVPFKGFLQGSTWYNLSTLLRESLLLASIAYFFGRWLNSYRTSAAILFLTVVLMTGLQLCLSGKQPDITTLIMALVIGILIERLSKLRL